MQPVCGEILLLGTALGRIKSFVCAENRPFDLFCLLSLRDPFCRAIISLLRKGIFFRPGVPSAFSHIFTWSLGVCALGLREMHQASALWPGLRSGQSKSLGVALPAATTAMCRFWWFFRRESTRTLGLQYSKEVIASHEGPLDSFFYSEL